VEGESIHVDLIITTQFTPGTLGDFRELAVKSVREPDARNGHVRFYLVIGDRLKADRELETAISAYKSSRSANSTSVYAMDRLAATLELLGSLCGEPQLLGEAIDLYEKMLRRDEWTSRGKGEDPPATRGHVPTQGSLERSDRRVHACPIIGWSPSRELTLGAV
jgi:hypothetical protein